MEELKVISVEGTQTKPKFFILGNKPMPRSTRAKSEMEDFKTFDFKSPTNSVQIRAKIPSPVAENNRKYRCIMMKRANINFAPKPDINAAAKNRNRLQRLVTSCHDYYDRSILSPSDQGSLDLDFVEEDDESQMTTPHDPAPLPPRFL
jgi:hypothetical protein